MVRAVCFDLDGTLFDDRQYVRAGLEAAAEALEADVDVDLTEEFLTAYFRRGIRERTFDVVLAEAGLSRDHVPALVEEYHDAEEDLVPYPDAEPTLDRLADSYRLGLITGGRNGRSKLRRLGLGEYFDTVIVTADRDDDKRAATPYEDALGALDARPVEGAFVGDRPGLDFPQPNRLGMHTIRVERGRYAAVEARGQAKPDVTVASLRELPDVLADVNCIDAETGSADPDTADTTDTTDANTADADTTDANTADADTTDAGTVDRTLDADSP